MHLFRAKHDIFNYIYQYEKEFTINHSTISQHVIQIYLNCLANKPTQIPTLQLRQFTVGIQNNDPVLGMRIFTQKLDIWV
jgi:hypothetical protein